MSLSFRTVAGGSPHLLVRPYTTRGHSPRATHFAGTLMLEIFNDGALTAEEVEVTAMGAQNVGVLLVGPTRNFSLAAGSVSPLGVQVRSSYLSGTALLEISWREAGTSFRASSSPFSITWSGVNQPNALALLSGQEFRTVPSVTLSQTITLSASQDIVSVSVGNPLPNSAFSVGQPNPSGPVLAGRAVSLTLGFTSALGKVRSPQVVSIQVLGASGQAETMPLYLWCQEPVVRRGDLVISAVTVDPAGKDLQKESITLTNRSTRCLDLFRCMLYDEASSARATGPFESFVFPRFLLASGASVQVFTKAGANSAHELYMGKSKPLWHRDCDTAVLLNSGGETVASLPSLFELPGVRSPGQSLSVDTTVLASFATDLTRSGVILEEGDLVVIDPVTTSRVWAGDLFIGATGPAGALALLAPEGGEWPLPGAPKYALLAGTLNRQSVPSFVYVGASRFTHVVTEGSALRPGDELILAVNDDVPGDGWGAYSARVRVFRK